MSKEVIDHRLKTVEMVEKLHKTIYNQDQKISDLEAKLKALQNGIIDDETLNMLVKEHKLYKDLETKLTESEKKAYSRGHSQRDIANEIKLNALREDVTNKEKRIVELKQQLAESETQLKEEIEEKKGVRRALTACNRQNDEFADMIKKLANENEELNQQLADKDKAIENWQTMYKSVVQTCYNDKEEIERLNKKLETQENIITNLVEDNRASQEWYRKQLAEKDKENTKLKEVVDCVDKLKQFNADMKDYALVNRDVADEIYCEHQDKISFCIEQLEKVKKFTEKEIKECDKLLQEEFEDDYYIQSVNARQSMCYEFKREIDNQIKAIKGDEVV